MAPWVSSGHSEKRHVRRRHALLHRHADEPREPAAAVLGRERHGRPAGLDVALVRLGEALRRGRPSRRRGGGCAARRRRGSAGRTARRRSVRPPRGCRRRSPGRRARSPGSAASAAEVGDVLEREPDVVQRRHVAPTCRSRYDRGSDAARGSKPYGSSRRWAAIVVAVGEHVARRAVDDDAAAVEDDRPLAQLQRVRQVVGDEDRRDVEAEHDLGQLAAGHADRGSTTARRARGRRAASPARSPGRRGGARRS